MTWVYDLSRGSHSRLTTSLFSTYYYADSESVQIHNKDDLTSNHIAIILYVTITVVVVESFIIFLLGVYVIMNKQKFQPPPTTSVPSISSSIAPPSSCSCADIFRRCPKCGNDVMSVPMMSGSSVSEETEKVRPGDQGPMFKWVTIERQIYCYLLMCHHVFYFRPVFAKMITILDSLTTSNE